MALMVSSSELLDRYLARSERRPHLGHRLCGIGTNIVRLKKPLHLTDHIRVSASELRLRVQINVSLLQAADCL